MWCGFGGFDCFTIIFNILTLVRLFVANDSWCKIQSNEIRAVFTTFGWSSKIRESQWIGFGKCSETQTLQHRDDQRVHICWNLGKHVCVLQLPPKNTSGHELTRTWKLLSLAYSNGPHGPQLISKVLPISENLYVIPSFASARAVDAAATTSDCRKNVRMSPYRFWLVGVKHLPMFPKRMGETSSKDLQTLAGTHNSWCLKSWPVFNINIFKMMLKKNRLGSMRLKKIPIYPIYLLVGGWPTPLKNMKVSWDDDIPNIWRFPIKTGGWAYPPEKWWSSSDWIIIPTDGKIKFMFQTTNQYWIIFDPVETFPAFAILLWSSLIFTRPRSDTVNLGRPAFFWMNRWKKKTQNENDKIQIQSQNGSEKIENLIFYFSQLCLMT